MYSDGADPAIEGGGVDLAVAVGEQQRELVRGVERGEGFLEVDHSDVAGRRLPSLGVLSIRRG